MPLKTLFSALIIATIGFSAAAQSQQIKIPVGQQAADLGDLQRPTTGMSREEVVRLYGQPLSETAAKGKPPISSSEYRLFRVFFEHDTVIHAVMKKQKPVIE